jgi:hypothetical protein
MLSVVMMNSFFGIVTIKSGSEVGRARVENHGLRLFWLFKIKILSYFVLKMLRLRVRLKLFLI